MRVVVPPAIHLEVVPVVCLRADRAFISRGGLVWWARMSGAIVNSSQGRAPRAHADAMLTRTAFASARAAPAQ
eukprot:5361872-Prymnesium_polylepis.1